MCYFGLCPCWYLRRTSGACFSYIHQTFDERVFFKQRHLEQTTNHRLGRLPARVIYHNDPVTDSLYLLTMSLWQFVHHGLFIAQRLATSTQHTGNTQQCGKSWPGCSDWTLMCNNFINRNPMRFLDSGRLSIEMTAVHIDTKGFIIGLDCNLQNRDDYLVLLSLIFEISGRHLSICLMVTLMERFVCNIFLRLQRIRS